MKKILWSFFEVVETVVIAVAAVVLVRMFVMQPFVVSGASMEPTFYDGNYLLVDEVTYQFRSPERGEVIVFKYPGDHKSFYIKRIIGLPGEKIILKDGKISVFSGGGGEIALNESYLGKGVTNGSFNLELGENEYFVLGDNRNFSFDSRSWGSLSQEEIIGVVRLRLWPISGLDTFAPPNYEN